MKYLGTRTSTTNGSKIILAELTEDEARRLATIPKECIDRTLEADASASTKHQQDWMDVSRRAHTKALESLALIFDHTPHNELVPAQRRLDIINSLYKFNVNAINKYCKGQHEHRGDIRDRHLNTEIKNEIMDLFFYTEAVMHWKDLPTSERHP